MMNPLRRAFWQRRGGSGPWPHREVPWGSDLRNWPAKLQELQVAKEILAEVFDITSVEVEDMIRQRRTV